MAPETGAPGVDEFAQVFTSDESDDGKAGHDGAEAKTLRNLRNSFISAFASSSSEEDGAAAASRRAAVFDDDDGLDDGDENELHWPFLPHVLQNGLSSALASRRPSYAAEIRPRMGSTGADPATGGGLFLGSPSSANSASGGPRTATAVGAVGDWRQRATSSSFHATVPHRLSMFEPHSPTSVASSWATNTERASYNSSVWTAQGNPLAGANAAVTANSPIPPHSSSIWGSTTNEGLPTETGNGSPLFSSARVDPAGPKLESLGTPSSSAGTKPRSLSFSLGQLQHQQQQQQTYINMSRALLQNKQQKQSRRQQQQQQQQQLQQHQHQHPLQLAEGEVPRAKRTVTSSHKTLPPDALDNTSVMMEGLMRREQDTSTATYRDIMAQVDLYFSSDEHRRPRGSIPVANSGNSTIPTLASLMTDLLRETSPASISPIGRLCLVEFKACRSDVFYVPEASRLTIRVGDLVIVEADRGRDLGKILACDLPYEGVLQVKERQHHMQQILLNAQAQPEHTVPEGGAAAAAAATAAAAAANGPASHFQPKQIYRLAQPNEVGMLISKAQDEAQATLVCSAKIRQRGLPMEAVDGEYQWDRRKLTFYYASEVRVDFRELVRDLFKIYKTRIWMCATETAKQASGGPPPLQASLTNVAAPVTYASESSRSQAHHWAGSTPFTPAGVLPTSEERGPMFHSSEIRQNLPFASMDVHGAGGQPPTVSQQRTAGAYPFPATAW